MAKEKTAYRCRECGATAPRWEGRCHACGDWNTLVEQGAGGQKARHEPLTRPVLVGEVALAASASRPTNLDELDRVLGGGLVPGSVTLLGGEPGVGKSTLITQVAASVARAGWRTLYVSAEESPAQVRQRAERLGALAPEMWLASESVLPHLLALLDEVR